MPQIHVNANGRVGLTYFDTENATTAQPGLTDAFIASCDSTTSDCSNSASWAVGGETRLSTAGSRFIAFFCMSKPIATTGRSDTFSNRAA